MTSQTYNLDGPKEFPFPHPVRSADQLTVEIVPGAAVAPGDYEVVGVGPTSTQVTVRYPNAPTSGGLQLKITRYVAPERVTQIDSPSDINVTNLNAEFNNVYEAMTDLEASVLQQVQDMLDNLQTYVQDTLDDFQTDVLDPAVATTLEARDEAVDARDAAQQAETGATEKWDGFRDLYWGAYATDPTESPVGNPPDAGDLYFNTTASEWRVWNGSAWQQPDTKVPSVYDRRDYVASGDTGQVEQYTSTEGQTFYAFPYDAPTVGVFATPWGPLVEGVDYTYEQGVGVTLIPGASAVPDPVPEGVSVNLFGTIPETFPVNYDPPFVQMWVNGALLPPSDYEASSGTDVVPNDPLPEGTEVTVIGISGVPAIELDTLAALVFETYEATLAGYTDDAEAAAQSSASDRADAEEARDEAVAAASGLNLPPVAPEDSGKALVVDEEGEGYTLASFPAYEQVDIDLSQFADFAAGTLRCIRIGNQVTLCTVGAPEFSSSTTSGSTGDGAVPASMRPSTLFASNTCGLGSLGPLLDIVCGLDGEVVIQFQTNQTTFPAHASLTYNI